MRVILTRSVAILSLTVIAGCHSVRQLRLYQGEERPPSEVVQILAPELIDVLSVDGEELQMPGLSLGQDTRLHLLPGRHTFEVRLSFILTLNRDNYRKITSRPVKLSLDGRAGERYRITYTIPADPAALENGQAAAIDIVREEAAIAVQMPPPARIPAATEIAPEGTVASDSEPPDHEDMSYVQMMKVWWRRATPAERRAFAEFIGRGE